MLAQEDIVELSGKNVSKRMKQNQQKDYAQKIQNRDDNKMVQEHEKSVKHRWINLTEKRGQGQTIIPHKFTVESIDSISSFLTLNVSRKFVPIGTPYKRYFVAADAGIDLDGAEETKASEKDGAGERVNTWGTKFREVDKLMAYLCYD